MLGIFNACDCTRRLYGHHKSVCTECRLWEKNPLLYQGIEPASPACRSTNWATSQLQTKLLLFFYAEDREPSFLQDTPPHDNTPPYQVWLKIVERFRRYCPKLDTRATDGHTLSDSNTHPAHPPLFVFFFFWWGDILTVTLWLKVSLGDGGGGI